VRCFRSKGTELETVESSTSHSPVGPPRPVTRIAFFTQVRVSPHRSTRISAHVLSIGSDLITFLWRVLSESKASSASSNSVIFHELELQMLAYCPQFMFLSIYRNSCIYKWSSSWFSFAIFFRSLFPYAHFSSGWRKLGNPTNIRLCIRGPALLIRIELPTRVRGMEGLLADNACRYFLHICQPPAYCR
jgi:hypothetical protein